MACVVALGVLAQAWPASAAAPLPGGIDTQATAFILQPGGITTGQVNCPPTQPGGTFPIFGGTATATCTPTDATATAQALTIGTTTILLAQATCNTTSNPTSQGTVTVSSAGGTPPGPQTFTNKNQAYTGIDGTTFVFNQVLFDGTFVTRNAIVVTGGPGAPAGTIVAQVVCRGIYPLAAGAPSQAGADAALSTQPAGSGSGGTSHTGLWLGAAIGVLLLAQVVVGLRIRRARAHTTG